MSKLDSVFFINTCSSEYVEIYVGTGPKKVREIFALARKNRPAIIFIDELEAMGVQRSSNISNYTNNLERNSTLNQLLAEMDGVEQNKDILVIAATNREDLLDPALVRPGRFDLKVHFDLPSKEERNNIFELYFKKHNLEYENSLIDKLSAKSEGLTGAVIESVVNKISCHCFEEKRLKIGNKFKPEEDSCLLILKKCKEENDKFRIYEERNKKG